MCTINMCTINMCNINICISLLQVTRKQELYNKRTLHCRNVAIVNFEPCYSSTFTCSCSLMMCVNCCFIALEVVIPKDRTFSKEQLVLCMYSNHWKVTPQFAPLNDLYANSCTQFRIAWCIANRVPLAFSWVGITTTSSECATEKQ